MVHKFEIRGKCKSNIRCRSFIYLKIKELEQFKNEIVEMTKSTLYQDDGNSYIKEISEWTELLIDLYGKNPNKKNIIIKLEHEKSELAKLVKHFAQKIIELKIDSSIPKISVINGNKNIDYTTLESAESMFFDYTGQFDFIKECINELNQCV
jgi:hypothetical protein